MVGLHRRLSRSKVFIVVVGLLGIVGLWWWQSPRFVAHAPSSLDSKPMEVATPAQVLKDFSFTIENQAVPLRDNFLMRPIASGSGVEKFALQPDSVTEGDLTGDGIPELLAVVFRQQPDARVTSYLVVLSNPDKPTQLTVMTLGKQVQVNALVVQDKVLELRMFQPTQDSANPKSPTTAIPVIKYFKLIDGQLKEAEPPSDGRPFQSTPLPKVNQ